ncbi:MAG: hypothetical protein ACLUHE_03990 [Christensenellales bacterium]
MLTLGVYDALKSADRLLLRTGRHGVAERLTREGVAFETLDALYERTEDFDELCELAARAIIDRARQAEALVYAVSEPQSDATVRALADALPEGFALRALGGVTLSGRGGLRGDSLRREHGEPAHGDGAFHGGDARAGRLPAGHHRDRQPLSRLGCEALAERFV